MARQCPEAVQQVRCVRNEGHEGDCWPPDPIRYGILENPQDWKRLQSYQEQDDAHGYALELRALCEDNVPLWGNMVLGHDPAPHFLDIRPELDIYDKIQVEAFRGSSKSTSYVLEEVTHHAAYSTMEESLWHGWTGLLVRESGPAAEKTMGEVRQKLRTNQLIKLMFPKLRDLGKKGGEHTKRWTDDLVWFTTSSQPTLEGLGPGGSMTGDHPDAGYMDDVVTKENSRTEHQRRQLQAWWDDSMEGVFDEAREIHLFTPYAHNDLNQVLKDSGKYHLIQIPALDQVPSRKKHIDHIEYGPDGETVLGVEPSEQGYEELASEWPCPIGPRNCVAYPRKERQKHFDRVGYHRSLKRLLYYFVTKPETFRRQYLLDLRPQGDALVAPENIRCFVYDEDDPRIGKTCSYNDTEVVHFPGWGNMMVSVHGWDHAIGTSADHDETAHAVLYRDQDNRTFVDPVDAGRWPSTEITEMMEDRFHADHQRTGMRPRWVMTEGVNFQRAFGEWLEKKGAGLIPVDVKTNPSDKAVEFVESGLQAAMVQGRVYFHVDDRDTIEQFLNFTGEEGRDDDRVDAVRIAYSKLSDEVKRNWKAYKAKGNDERGSSSRRRAGSLFGGGRGGRRGRRRR